MQNSSFVIQNSSLFILTSQSESVEGLRGRAEVERRVAGDVIVLLEVLNHLLVGVLPLRGGFQISASITIRSDYKV